jgi:hypothetical protein
MRRADNFTIFVCRVSLNLGASASWNTKVLSSPVKGLLYLYLYIGLSVSNAYKIDQKNYKVLCRANLLKSVNYPHY